MIIYIESTQKTCPVRGMTPNGKNGEFYCYKSNNSYSEKMVRILMPKLKEKHGVDNITAI